jgi:thioredoxin reductase
VGDTPELFGGEIRALGVIDLEDGKITRWVDYWDAHAFGESAAGFIRTGQDTPATSGPVPGRLPLETTIPGVFAAGDVRSGSIKRVASAVGEGSMAVRLIHDHLARQLV